MKPKVTIGLPMLDAARTLVSAIRSVLAQTCASWEMFIVDDGSTDSSVDVARGIYDPRITVIADGKHVGLATRLNQISGLGNAALIARMDADDMMHPDRLIAQIAHLNRNEELDVLGSAAYVVDENEALVGTRGFAPRLDPKSILHHGYFIHPTVMARRHWCLVNQYDPAFVRAEDHELWCRTCRTSRFDTLPSPLLFYRQNRILGRGYAVSCRTDRAILRRYGRELDGNLGAAVAWSRSCAKELAVRVLDARLAGAALLWAQNEPLSAKQRVAAEEALIRIRSVGVPVRQRGIAPTVAALGDGANVG